MDEREQRAVDDSRTSRWARRTRRRRGRPAAVGLVLAGLVVAAACSGSGEEAGSEAADGVVAGEAVAVGAPGDAGGPEPEQSVGRPGVGSSAVQSATDGAGAALVDPLVAGRDVVVSGSVTVSTDDPVAAALDVADAAVRAGGYVAEESSGLDDLDDGVRLVLRVPPTGFAELRDSVAGLGTEVSRSTSTDDVTQQVLDVESRLATQRASVERVRALLEQAGDLAEVVAVEAELTRRQADLESLEARSAALETQVRLATLVVRLVPPDSALLEAAAPGFLAGLERGWAAFGASLAVLATGAGLLLPFLMAACLLAVPLVALRRRRTAPVPVRPTDAT